MYISKWYLDRILTEAKFTFNGCHAPHPDTPLYGRRAYFSVECSLGYVSKITFPVESMNPSQKTLDKGLRKEIEKRINAIQLKLDCDHYGTASIIEVDPYSIRPLVEQYCCEFKNNWAYVERQKQRGAK